MSQRPTASHADDSEIAAYIARLGADPQLALMDPEQRYRHVQDAIDRMIDAHNAGALVEQMDALACAPASQSADDSPVTV